MIYFKYEPHQYPAFYVAFENRIDMIERENEERGFFDSRIPRSATISEVCEILRGNYRSVSRISRAEYLKAVK